VGETATTRQWDRPTLAIAFAAGLLSIGAALANFIAFNGYPLFRIELLPTVIGIGVVAGVFALIYVGLRPALLVLVDGMLTAFAVDLATEGWLWPILLGLGAALTSVLMRGRFIRLAAIFSSFVLFSSLVGVARAQPWLEVQRNRPNDTPAPPENGPAIVHVLFDEHLGPGGFPDTADGRRGQQFLRDFYVSRGFTLFEHAFSRHLHTINAIPDILNLGAALDEPVDKDDPIAPSLAYFEVLRGDGYPVTLYQSGYLNLCASNSVEKCATYRDSGIAAVQETPLSTSDKAVIIGVNFLSLSDAILAFSEWYDRGVEDHRRWPRSPLNLRRTAPLTALKAADAFRRELEGAQPGHAYFYHGLLPHYPYATTSDCEVKDLNDWRQRKDSHSLSDRNAAYLEQVKCAANLVDEFVGAISSSAAGRNFVVIVHGDHGSRITQRDPRSYSRSISPKDLLAGYSTLFAVRLPEPAPGSINGTISAPALLESLAEHHFVALRPNVEADPQVWLDDRDWRPQRQIAFPQSN